MHWPTDLQINAWAGPDVANTSTVADDLERRFLGKGIVGDDQYLGPSMPDLTDWMNPENGWGLVLPDYETDNPAEKAGLRDADPEPLHALREKRGNGPIFRYDPTRTDGALLRYDENGKARPVNPSAFLFGVEQGYMPRYMTIFGSPEEIPWSVQYALQASRFTGRIDLDAEDGSLENYVNAIVQDWANVDPDPAAMTIWAVDHGRHDITHLMHNAIAAPLAGKFDGYPEYRPDFIARDAATQQGLIRSLGGTVPAFVATTSHGATHPLSDVPAMRAQLGLPVDAHHALTDPAALLQGWQPNGTIWYAQACCSAGANRMSDFVDFVPAGSGVAHILNGVAKCGAMTAPLPRALMGAAKPLRAFVGHVEPTFNWTLRHTTGQFMTNPLLTSFFTGLYSGLPLGMALDECRRASASLLAEFSMTRNNYLDGADLGGQLLRLQLTAKDWQSFVLLGDPAVGLHRPPPIRTG